MPYSASDSPHSHQLTHSLPLAMVCTLATTLVIQGVSLSPARAIASPTAPDTLSSAVPSPVPSADWTTNRSAPSPSASSAASTTRVSLNILNFKLPALTAPLRRLSPSGLSFPVSPHQPPTLRPSSSSPNTTTDTTTNITTVAVADALGQPDQAPTTMKPVILSFDLPALGATQGGDTAANNPVASVPSVAGLPPSLANLFVGDSYSLVAIAIGGAEGTRTPDGERTWAFKGHTDPGNGVWNLGTFSWQHGANSPEEADRKQLARLKRQAATLHKRAIERGVPWGLEEQLNALDLANQSPMAALDPGGYIDRLEEAHDDGLRGSDAILWARTWSYRHPSGTRWNAPGLGNTHHGIRTDQHRRMRAIRDAMDAFSGPPVSQAPSSEAVPHTPAAGHALPLPAETVPRETVPRETVPTNTGEPVSPATAPPAAPSSPPSQNTPQQPPAAEPGQRKRSPLFERLRQNLQEARLIDTLLATNLEPAEL